MRVPRGAEHDDEGIPSSRSPKIFTMSRPALFTSGLRLPSVRQARLWLRWGNLSLKRFDDSTKKDFWSEEAAATNSGSFTLVSGTFFARRVAKEMDKQ